MTRSAVPAVLDEAKPRIAKHWSSCLKARLPGFTPARTRKVDKALESYCATLAGLKAPSSKEVILAAIKTLFTELDRINADAEGGLLETDERELLVPVIINAASAAGLNASEFESGDPTYQFRNF